MAKIFLPKNKNKNSKRNGRRRSKRTGFGPQSGKGAASGAASASNTNLSMVIRNLPLFAERTKRTLQYYTEMSITGAASAANAYVFSCNGMYDPDITGTGGQPMGFDQMMSFYNHYTVVRSKIQVILSNTSTADLVSCGVLLSGSSTVTSNIEDMIENGDIVLSTLTFYGQPGCMAKIVKNCDCAKFQGIDDIMDDPNMRGDAASNPVEQMYFHVVDYNPYTANVIGLRAQVLIQFEAVFHEPRKGPLS